MALLFAVFSYICPKEKKLLQEAKTLFDYFCENVSPVFRNLGDLDPTEDYEEVMKQLGSQLERRWYELWTLIYDEVECFIIENES